MGGCFAKMAAACRVLVTGGSGLVGMGIKEVVTDSPEDPELGRSAEWMFAGSRDGDLRDATQTMALFDQFKPTHVIHLAANVGGLFKNMKYRVEMYPDNTAYPIDEEMVHNGPPHSSNEGYAYAKRMVDVMNRNYHMQHGRLFTSAIPTNIYGRHDNFHLEDSHVIPGLIHKLYNAKQTGEDFVAWGSGAPLRQFIFARDLARLVVWQLWNYDSVEPLIISVDEADEVPISEVVNTIARAMDFQGEIRFDTTKADGQFKKTASNRKLRTLLPDFEFTNFEEGIQQTVQWFAANYDSARK